MAVFRVHREDDHRGSRRDLGQYANRLGTLATRHVDVEDQDVPVFSCRALDQTDGSRRLSTKLDLRILGEQALQPATDDVVVVGDKYADHACISSCRSQRGILTTISHPAPGRLKIVHSPCNRRERS